jgi:hypothetical protein
MEEGDVQNVRINSHRICYAHNWEVWYSLESFTGDEINTVCWI